MYVTVINNAVFKNNRIIFILRARVKPLRINTDFNTAWVLKSEHVIKIQQLTAISEKYHELHLIEFSNVIFHEINLR